MLRLLGVNRCERKEGQPRPQIHDMAVVPTAGIEVLFRLHRLALVDRVQRLRPSAAQPERDLSRGLAVRRAQPPAEAALVYGREQNALERKAAKLRREARDP